MIFNAGLASPAAILFASCFIPACNLEIFFRRPLSLTVIFSLSARFKSVFKFLLPSGRPLGLPDWPCRKRVAASAEHTPAWVSPQKHWNSSMTHPASLDRAAASAAIFSSWSNVRPDSTPVALPTLSAIPCNPPSCRVPVDPGAVKTFSLFAGRRNRSSMDSASGLKKECV
jgi:hypothetical protein